MESMDICQLGKCARHTHGFPSIDFVGLTNHASLPLNLNLTLSNPCQLSFCTSEICWALTEITLITKPRQKNKIVFMTVLVNFIQINQLIHCSILEIVVNIAYSKEHPQNISFILFKRLSFTFINEKKKMSEN